MWWNEHAGIAYFEYPQRGIVYSVDLHATDEHCAVRLPQGALLRLVDCPEHTVKLASALPTGTEIHAAVKVFDPFHDDAYYYDGDWHKLIHYLGAAYATNNLFHVILSEVDYESFVAGLWARLQQELHFADPDIIRLHEHFYMDDQERPGIELLRYGCCPNF